MQRYKILIFLFLLSLTFASEGSVHTGVNLSLRADGERTSYSKLNLFGQKSKICSSPCRARLSSGVPINIGVNRRKDKSLLEKVSSMWIDLEIQSATDIFPNTDRSSLCHLNQLFYKTQYTFPNLLIDQTLSGYSPAKYNHKRFVPATNYLDSLKQELQKKWPHNRTINLVFHGHSVPTGYRTKGVVHRLHSYPFLTLKKINESYPHSVVNVITTSIGGEQAEQGALRMKDEVLTHRPDVLFIDYALNDRSIGLERAKSAWEKMIREAKAYGTKVILLTPTPDLKEDIFSPDTELARHSAQIRKLAEKYEVGLVDSYALFMEIARTEDLNSYMAQNNHINDKGHEVVAGAIMEYFKE